MFWTALALLRKKPVGRTAASRVARRIRANASAVLARRKSFAVTSFTLSSVHWAARIVATRSSKGVEKLSRHPASGYVWMSRSAIRRARSLGAVFDSAATVASFPSGSRAL